MFACLPRACVLRPFVRTVDSWRAGGLSVLLGTFSDQVHESWERDNIDQANIWHVGTSTNVCYVNKSWKQYIWLIALWSVFFLARLANTPAVGTQFQDKTAFISENTRTGALTVRTLIEASEGQVKCVYVSRKTRTRTYFCVWVGVEVLWRQRSLHSKLN